MRTLLQDDEGVDPVLATLLVTSAISLVGSIFIIVNYIAIKSLRNQLSYKLILWVAVSDAILAVSNLFAIGDIGRNNVLCIIQGMIGQFSSIASLFWVVAISWTIDHLMHSPKILTKGELRRTLKIMHSIIWSLSLITTVIPLFTSTYGPSGGLYGFLICSVLYYLTDSPSFYL